MSFAKVYSAQTSLLKPYTVDIEVDLSNGLHAFSVVGLGDKAVDESKDRISAAIKNSGFGFKSPKNKNQKVVVSLAPADIKKEGPIFDLAIALAYLLASEEIEFDPKKKLFLGELSLDGEVRKINGVLPLVDYAKKRGFEEVYLPAQNAKEGALIEGISIFAVNTLKDAINHLHHGETIGKEENEKPHSKIELSPQEKTEVEYKDEEFSVDFADIKGQEGAKRGLEIAAAGGHNLAMFGPAGTGKTMLAKAFAHVLPPLTFPEILETTGIHSVAGSLKDTLVTHPPFRSPHHTSSYVSLVGGGTYPKPGEITLAHRGVLFLDEFPEFERRVIDSLRQPLEERVVSISRAKGSTLFPANFILIAAMNPCPCGNYGIQGKQCICSPIHIERYKRKVSGPIVDRIDLWIEVSKVEHEKLSKKSATGVTTKELREKIVKARKIQAKRFKGNKRDIKTNSEMGVKDLEKYVALSEPVIDILNQSARTLDLSARSYHRLIKLSRTIADLENSEEIAPEHLYEALQYRPKRIAS
ncbi:MAG: YifB family Mg chelatase-like AAA ATPase [Candidatus Taylorbacteria bacterium]